MKHFFSILLFMPYGCPVFLLDLGDSTGLIFMYDSPNLVPFLFITAQGLMKSYMICGIYSNLDLIILL